VNLYETLNVKKDASQKEIKAAYKKMASKHHPDREGGSSKEMANINSAYDILGNETKRKRYDETGSTTKEPNILEQAVNLIHTRLFALMGQHHFTKKNYFVIMRKELEENLKAVEKQIKRISTEMEKFEYLMENSKLPELVREGLLGERERIAQQVKSLESQIPLFEQCGTLLDQCEYTGIVPEKSSIFTEGFNMPGGRINMNGTV
jgi:curved DNA-binding protein CbpA